MLSGLRGTFIASEYDFFPDPSSYELSIRSNSSSVTAIGCHHLQHHIVLDIHKQLLMLAFSYF